jgi:hypothetical protein
LAVDTVHSLWAVYFIINYTFQLSFFYGTVPQEEDEIKENLPQIQEEYYKLIVEAAKLES